MACQQIRDDRTFAASGHNGWRNERGGDIVWRRHVPEAGDTAVFPLPFIGDKEENLVLDDGTAQ